MDEDKDFLKDFEEIKAFSGVGNLNQDKTIFADENNWKNIANDVSTLWKDGKVLETQILAIVDQVWKRECAVKKKKDDKKENILLLEIEKERLLKDLKLNENQRQEIVEEVSKARCAETEMTLHSLVNSDRNKAVSDLIKTITHIKFKCDDEHEQLNGAFFSSDIKTFSYDLNKFSELEITNELWKLLKGEANKKDVQEL